MTRIIGIGGTSRSGKSSLALHLQKILPRTSVIHQDQFNAEELPMIRDHIDWEIPAAVNYGEIIAEIEKQALLYENIVVEGILIFSDPLLNSMFTHRILLILSWEEFRSRKTRDLRWGREPDWYIRHIWESFLEYNPPDPGYPVLWLYANNGVPEEDVIKYIIS